MSKSHEVPFIKNINERGKKESSIFAQSSICDQREGSFVISKFTDWYFAFPEKVLGNKLYYLCYYLFVQRWWCSGEYSCLPSTYIVLAHWNVAYKIALTKAESSVLELISVVKSSRLAVC